MLVLAPAARARGGQGPLKQQGPLLQFPLRVQMSLASLITMIALLLSGDVLVVRTRAQQQLVFCELDYHPAAPSGAEARMGLDSASDFEYLKLLNPGPSTVDLTGCALTTGVHFAFERVTDSEGDPRPGPALNWTIGPGEFVLLGRDLAALAARFGEQAVLPFFAGAYSGKLSNSGEALTLACESGVGDVAAYYTDQVAHAADGG
eukprot:SAG22_NODE_8108_length_682_cov_0.876501_1_plen_204_part_01